MAANINPTFPLTPVTTIVAVMNNAVTTTNGDLSGADVRTVFTGGTNGSRVDYIKVRPTGTNAATVFRIFINNGGSAATASNNALFMERTLATTSSTQTAELADNLIQLDLPLPTGYKLLCTIGTATGGGTAAGWVPTGVGGDY